MHERAQTREEKLVLLAHCTNIAINNRRFSQNNEYLLVSLAKFYKWVAYQIPGDLFMLMESGNVTSESDRCIVW